MLEAKKNHVKKKQEKNSEKTVFQKVFHKVVLSNVVSPGSFPRWYESQYTQSTQAVTTDRYKKCEQ